MPKIDLEQIYHAYTLDENDKSWVERFFKKTRRTYRYNVF